MEVGVKTMIENDFYEAPNLSKWQGRIDGNNENQLYWNQTIKAIDLKKNFSFEFQYKNKMEHVVFLGFSSDEGVRRNKGRIGAALAPDEIRNACGRHPVHNALQLHDAGNILCPDGRLEEAQEHLANAVFRILKSGAFPILLGGGHEITFGHYQGIKQMYPSKTIGAVNFDAHFDNRTPGQEGADSGTGFWQIHQTLENEARFHYLSLGIQKSANTKELFDRANNQGSTFILDKELNVFTNEYVKNTILSFCEEVDGIYLSVDLDVFSAAYAPGVSAVNPNGIAPDHLFDNYLSLLCASKKIVSFDLAELNPIYDIDQRTAKLAARIIFEVLDHLT